MDAPTETKKRGRPPKKREEVVEEPVLYEQELTEPLQMSEIKHVMDVIAIPGNEWSQGTAPVPINVIEDKLNQNYFTQGYSLFAVYHIRVVVGEGEQPIGHEMLYVLVNDAITCVCAYW
jgi:hypothetical protein